MAPIACFVSASRQNVFFAELLDALADELAAQGVAIERAVDHFPAPRDGLAYVFVPHELMPLLMDDAQPDAHQLARSVTICTEQPGTHWFAETAAIASRSAATVDINQVGVAALHELGIAATFLQLGYTPKWDRWGGDARAERSIDVAMLAGATPRRLTAVARCADQLAGRRTELHLPEALVPHRADSEVFISGVRKWELLARSRLLLNVHRGELGYFEWQRAVEAITNGCVLLSEHSLGFAPLIPGEHFLSVSCDSLDVALEGLLDDEPRLARMRASAYELLREEYPLSSSISVLAEAVAHAARLPSIPASDTAPAHAPRPRPPQLPPPAWEAYDLVDRRGAEREVVEVAVRRSGPEPTTPITPPADRMERFGTPAPSTPRVSVVLAVADQSGPAAAAIEAVAVSDFTDFELLVVDASGDATGGAIRSALAGVPWIAATLITRGPGNGLAWARNFATELAVGEFVLFLGARDVPFPHALGRLVRALDELPEAAFAYGIVAQRGAHGPSGLTGYLSWDPTLLRYGNYIESMVMVRRLAMTDVGGFATDELLAGWEDLALWCALADRDWRGTRVPEIVASQEVALRPPAASASASSAAWSLLLERFASLAA